MIGVSRPPLREALNSLQMMGFIEIGPRSKIILRFAATQFFEGPINLLIGDDVHRILELLEIGKIMESWSGYKAAERSTEEDIVNLRRIIEKDQEILGKTRIIPKLMAIST
jgi:DNA-binding FadR family transcriptional regulator